MIVAELKAGGGAFGEGAETLAQPWPEFAVGGERAGIRAVLSGAYVTSKFGVCPQAGRCRAAQPTARIVLGAEIPSFLKISASSGWIVVA